MISILVPIRPGPDLDMLDESIKSIFDNSAHPKELELLFHVKSHEDAREIERLDSCRRATIVIGKDKGIRGIHEYVNTIAEQSTGDWIGTAGDDTEYLTDGWDDIIGRYPSKQPFALWTRYSPLDGIYHVPFVSRAGYDAIGCFSPHPFADTFQREVFREFNLWHNVQQVLVNNKYIGSMDKEFIDEGCENFGPVVHRYRAKLGKTLELLGPRSELSELEKE